MRKLVPTTRKMVQIGILFGLLSITLMSHSSVVFQQYGINAYDYVRQMGSGEDYFFYMLFDRTLGQSDNGISIADQTKGWVWSLSIFGIPISDPMAGLGYLVSNRSWHVPFLLSLIIPLVLVYLTGRSFCGWICPVNSILEWNDGIRKTVATFLLGKLPNLQAPLNTKNYLLLGGLIIAAVSGISIFPFILPYVVLGREVHMLVYSDVLSVGIFFLIGIVLFELLVSRRAWCRYLCPTGGLLALLSRPAMLKIHKTETECRDGCSVCQQVCPIQINPKSDMEVKDCFQCGTCVSRCPDNLLHFSWKPRSVVPTAIGIVFFLLLAPATTGAHHMRGLPHYGYTENYPQAPVKELTLSKNGYTMKLTTYYFQGLQKEDSDTPDAVQIYLHLENEKKKKTYMGPLTLEIWKDKEKVYSGERDSPLEESSYRFRTEVPSGKYQLVVKLPDRSFQMKIDLGAPSKSHLKIYLLVGSVVVVLLLAGFRKRLRRGVRKSPRVPGEQLAE